MSNLSFRSVLTVAAGALAMMIPSMARATIQPCLQLTIDKWSTNPQCVNEADTHAKEDPVCYFVNSQDVTNLAGPHLVRTFAAGQEGDVLFTEGPAASCDLNAILQTALACQADPGCYPLAQNGCSDVIRYVNATVNGQTQGVIWLINDNTSAADVVTILQQYALPANAAAPVVVHEPAGEPTDVPFNDVRGLVQIGLNASAVKVRFVDDPTNMAFFCFGQTGSPFVSDIMQVAVPAAPPVALFGLAGLLAATGLVLARRRRRGFDSLSL